MKVHIVVIEHRHGHNHYACQTEELANKVAQAYVENNWKSEMRDRVGRKALPIPKDPEVMVEKYFTHMEQRTQPEFLSIEKVEVIQRAEQVPTMF